MTNETKPVQVELLRRLVHYDPLTGALIWKARPKQDFAQPYGAKRWSAIFAGKAAGNLHPRGYIRVQILGHDYAAHRIAWAIHHGEWPSGQVDHVNHDRADNRIKNLRIVSHLQNGQNQKKFRTNTSGVTGVMRHRSTQKWQAQIKVNYKQIHLGIFADFDAAVAARHAAEKQYGFHPNHGRIAK